MESSNVSESLSLSLSLSYLILSYLDWFIALLRQSDPNWGAFFFITDDKPFEKRLNEIIGKFHDPRIEYVDVPMQYRPKVTQGTSISFHCLLSSPF